MRAGDWKLVAVKGAQWELFNIEQDRTESNNLADRYPDKVLEMEKQWNKLLGEIREVASQKDDTIQEVSVTTKNLE